VMAGLVPQDTQLADLQGGAQALADVFMLA
jgi:hypothetical protein